LVSWQLLLHVIQLHFTGSHKLTVYTIREVLELLSPEAREIFAK
jgi:hypothetical protein